MLGEPLPPHLNSELMGKTFFALIEERYPSAEKVLQIATKLGVETISAKIILLSVMRDAVKQVSPKLYRSMQHRDDLYAAIIAALEELEDKLEELEEQEAQNASEEEEPI